jgi:hypothetical protein
MPYGIGSGSKAALNENRKGGEFVYKNKSREQNLTYMLVNEGIFSLATLMG